MKREQKIDLKNRTADDKKLNGWVSITGQTLNDASLDELAVISRLLDKVGVSLELTRNEDSEAGISYDFIVLKVNQEKYSKAMTRQAGRKPNFNQKYDTYGKCTVAELKEKLKTTTKSQIARELGCSRMTLYRILNNISQCNPDETTSIWHYTS